MANGSVQRSGLVEPRTGFLKPRDRSGQNIDLTPIAPLLDRIIAAWQPERIWLFGSRARGDAQNRSDWDLFVTVPDEVPDEQLGPLASWKLRKATRTRADVLACPATEFRTAQDTPNTMAYEVAREGVLVYER